MTSMVSLIRSVNVGGANPLAMASLRGLLEGLGMGRVRTYLQSGNAVFESDAPDARAIEAAIEQALLRTQGLSVKVLVKTGRALRSVIAANPFGDGTDEKFLHATFLIRPPGGPGLGGAALPLRPGERAELRGGVVYVYCPLGYGSTRIGGAFMERRLGCPVTTRNWRTLRELARMAGEP